MPPTRSIRQRATNDENDENKELTKASTKASTRLTRAKAASLGVAEDVSALPVKKVLAEKKSTNSTTNRGAGQKRAALGDLSNVKKNEVIEAKENRKPMPAKPGLVSKAQSAGVQKSSKSSSNRPVLGAKDANKTHTSSDLKRSASGSGIRGGVAKKRNTGSSGSQQTVRSMKEEEEADLENQPPQSSNIIPLEEPAPVEVKYQPKVEEIDEQEGDVKQEIDEGVLDLDEQDLGDPLMVAEYSPEIFDYLRDLEEVTMPNANYMDHQTFLGWHLRSVLVDWLVEVHTRFHLLPETLFLAINLIDRFLTCRVVQLDKLQLVGITAMFIASKYEEVLSPHIQNFKHVADDGFSEDEILRAERFILQTLDYDLSYPNPMNFLRRISKADNYDIQTRTIGKYLLEIGLVDHRLLAFHPSHIAAASMYLARLILEKGPWDATIAHYSGYTEQEIQPVFKLMVDYLRKPVVHEAFFKKYASKKFLKASILTRQWAKRNWEMYLSGEDEISLVQDHRQQTLLKEESKDRKQRLLKEESKDRW